MQSVFFTGCKAHQYLKGLAKEYKFRWNREFLEWKSLLFYHVDEDFLRQKQVEELKTLLASDFLKQNYFDPPKSLYEKAKRELFEMGIEPSDPDIRRYTVLRLIVDYDQGRFRLRKKNGALYVSNEMKRQIEVDSVAYVRFAYFLKLINIEWDKLLPIADTADGGKNDEKISYLIHPAIKDDQILEIHSELKRLVRTQRIPEICLYLQQMKKEGKILLPASPLTAFTELKRLGMPNGEGFTEKNFKKYYIY